MFRSYVRMTTRRGLTFQALTLNLDQYVLYVHKLGDEWVARIEKGPNGLVMVFKRPSQEQAQLCAITMALVDAGLTDAEIAKTVQSISGWKPAKLVLEP